jgi:hypothetical protein
MDYGCRDFLAHQVKMQTKEITGAIMKIKIAPPEWRKHNGSIKMVTGAFSLTCSLPFVPCLLLSFFSIFYYYIK